MIWFIGVWILTLGIKIALSSLVPFAPDEAYYWVWSLHPQLSYFDHPGMVSWLLSLGAIFGDIPQGQRIPSIFLNHCLLIVWFFILKNLWSKDLTKTWLILFLASPFLGVGSILVTPDAPVLFFWSLSLLFFLQQQKSNQWYWPLLLGLSLGLGFCSKYHIVLLVIGLLLYLFFEKRWKTIKARDWLLVVIGGLATSWPVLLWNIQNDFASFRFQLNHGLGKSDWQPHWTGDYILGQILVFFPSLLYLYFKGFRFQKLRLYFWTSLVPWAVFLFTSFRGAVQANWPIVSYPAALVLVVAASKSMKHLRTVIAIWVIAEIFVVSQWIYPWWSTAPDKLQEVHQLRTHLPDVEKYQPLYGGSYQIASIFWYYGKKPVYKLRGMSRFDFFDQLTPSIPESSSFFVFRTTNEPLPEWLRKLKPETRIVESFTNYELIEVRP